MIKQLLKLRLRATFLGTMGKRRDGTTAKPSVGKIILFAFLYSYIVIVFAGLFTLMAIGMAAEMIALGLDWFYFAVFMVIAFSFIFIFSIFETKSELFECKDNELLLSMPIDPRHIVISRIFAVLVYNYAEEALVMLPCIIVYAAMGGSVTGIIGAVIVSLVLPLLATALASGVGYLVALIAKRLKKNSIITAAISLVFLLLYFWAYFSFLGGTASDESGPDIGAMAEQLSAFKIIGSAAMLHPLWTTLFVAVSLVAAYAAYRIISASYISIVTDNRAASRTEYKARTLEKSSAFIALTKKELKRFFSSSAYMLNAGLGVVFVVIFAVFAVVETATIDSLVLELGAVLHGVDVNGSVSAVMTAALVFCSSMTYISAAALSLEGKNLWILRSMPISGRTVLFAKAMPHIIVTTPPTLVASVLLMIATRAHPAYWAFYILTPLMANVMSAFFGIVINTAFPKFEYVNEAQPVKQSLSIFIVMMSMMLYGLIISGISIVLSIFVHPIFASVIVFLLTAALTAAFAAFIAGPSARKYESLGL